MPLRGDPINKMLSRVRAQRALTPTPTPVRLTDKLDRSAFYFHRRSRVRYPSSKSEQYT